jgi:hypothetical protein
LLNAINNEQRAPVRTGRIFGFLAESFQQRTRSLLNSDGNEPLVTERAQ